METVALSLTSEERDDYWFDLMETCRLAGWGSLWSVIGMDAVHPANAYYLESL